MRRERREDPGEVPDTRKVFKDSPAAQTTVAKGANCRDLRVSRNTDITVLSCRNFNSEMAIVGIIEVIEVSLIAQFRWLWQFA